MSTPPVPVLLDQADAHIREGRLGPAEACAEAALRLEPRNPRANFVMAVLQAETGRLEDSVESYHRSLQAEPRNVHGYANVGTVLRRLGRFDQAASAFAQAAALRQDPAVLDSLGYVLAKANRVADSIAAYQRAVAIAPDFTQAWISLGEMLQKVQRDAEAVAALDRALALDPANVSVRFLRQALAGESVDAAPPEFVGHFFDAFAPEFEQRLTGELEYRLPQSVAAALAPWLEPRKALRVADLGCGTGLSGAIVRASAAELVGVDLSAGMLERARARGLYDRLEQQDVAAFLEARPAATLDLLLALDVFIYVGALERVLAASARALAPEGRLAFSVESLDGDGFALRRTGRFAHSASYVERVAKAAGLRVDQRQETVIRKDAGADIAGAIYLLAPGSAAPR